MNRRSFFGGSIAAVVAAITPIAARANQITEAIPAGFNRQTETEILVDRFSINDTAPLFEVKNGAAHINSVLIDFSHTVRVSINCEGEQYIVGHGIRTGVNPKDPG